MNSIQKFLQAALQGAIIDEAQNIYLPPLGAETGKEQEGWDAAPGDEISSHWAAGEKVQRE